jgi:hypothetical protein
MRALLLALMLVTAPATARYRLGFYAHEHGGDFPHALITVKGAPDAGGTAVDTNFGFTAKTISPAILTGSVAGRVEAEKPSYLAHSQLQFSLSITDAQYAALQAVVARWSTPPGSTYSLNKHNCVSFVAEALQALGINAPLERALIKHPKAYFESVMKANPALKP